MEEEAKKHQELARHHQKEAARVEKEIASLRQIISPSTSGTDKTQAASIPVVATQEETKIKFDEEERSKSHYVIFNGPNQGIFDDWSKAAIFITGQKGIHHKKYSSLQEAKNALEEYRTTTYAAKAKQVAVEPAKKLPIIGRLPIKKVLTINNVQSKQERAESIKLTNNIFQQEYNFLLKYKDEDKVTSIYPIGGSHQGPKAVALPEADPLKVYMMFQSGLLSAIYFKGNDLFHFFPDKIKKTIQIYNQRILQGRTGFLKIYATYPVFGEGEELEEVKQQAIQLCQLGVSNNNYPDIEAVEFEDELTHFLNNYVLILIRGIKIRGRINYASKAILIWSLQAKQSTEEDKTLLDKFLHEVITVNYDFTKDVKKEICIKLNEEFPEDHVCTTCQPPSDESNDDTKDEVMQASTSQEQ